MENNKSLKDISYEFDPLLMNEIHWERIKQIQQWGGAEHDDSHDYGDWFDYIYHQMELTDARDPQPRLIKIAALAIAAIESLDRKYGR